MEFFDIRPVGIKAENGRKLLLTAAFVAIVLLLRALVARLAGVALRGRDAQARSWARQALGLAAGLPIILGLLSIWFDDPARLATGLGPVSAGLAFALQKVVTAIAGYVVILRGRNFAVGDRITMGGVRGFDQHCGECAGAAVAWAGRRRPGAVPAVIRAVWCGADDRAARRGILCRPVGARLGAYGWREATCHWWWVDTARVVAANPLETARKGAAHATPPLPLPVVAALVLDVGGHAGGDDGTVAEVSTDSMVARRSAPQRPPRP